MIGATMRQISDQAEGCCYNAPGERRWDCRDPKQRCWRQYAFGLIFQRTLNGGSQRSKLVFLQGAALHLNPRKCRARNLYHTLSSVRQLHFINVYSQAITVHPLAIGSRNSQFATGSRLADLAPMNLNSAVGVWR